MVARRRESPTGPHRRARHAARAGRAHWLSASLLSPELLQALAAGTAPWPIEVLYLASANALTGPRVLVEVAVDDIVSSIDWNERAPTG